jgi:hypothetical protein
MDTAPEKNGADVLEHVFALWKEFDPVEAYAAGLKDYDGTLFIPSDKAIKSLTGRIAAIELRLGEIGNILHRTVAKKLCEMIRAALLYDSPHAEVLNCAIALWYVVLKKEFGHDFVIPLLKNITQTLRLEHCKWQGRVLSGESYKTVNDAVAFLREMLSTVLEMNQKAADAIEEVSLSLRAFSSLLPPTIPGDFSSLLAFFEQHSFPAVPTEGYRDGLARLYDYGDSAEEILRESKKTLDVEIGQAERLIPKLRKHLGLHGALDLGEAYDKMTSLYAIKEGVANEATKILKAVQPFTDSYLQDLPNGVDIEPEKTPPYLVNLVTSGATLALNYLRAYPEVHIYVTEEKNKSWLTLVNVLVHEATHAYHPIILSQTDSTSPATRLPILLRIRTYLAVPLMEAAAFCREMEMFEAVRDIKTKPNPNEVEKNLLEIFESRGFPLDDVVNCFELETRIWRIIRALRAICDVEVNSGVRTYVQFLSWAEQYSGLRKEFIHNECFTFLGSPGYTPSYSFCGSKYEKLQKQAVSRRDFNTRAHRMGLLPWTTCLVELESFID